MTKDSIAALVEGIHFDGSGNITNINTSGLVTTADFNSLLSKKVSFDAAGHITNIDKSGLITESNLVQMFAEKTASDGYVKKSYIAAFVTELPDGRFQSNALVSADQIRLEGIVTANSYFKILENGAIEAISGTIGGIKITNEGLGSYISGWHPIDIPAMKLSNSGLHFSKGIQYNHAGGPQFASYDVDIGADGLFVTVEDSSGGRFYDVMNVVAGRHGLKISNSGVFKTSDGGSTWVEI